LKFTVLAEQQNPRKWINTQIWRISQLKKPIRVCDTLLNFLYVFNCSF